MADAKNAQIYSAPGLSPDILRARAQRRRETAARLWDERLERLLIEEAEELERRADALVLDTAVRAEEKTAQTKAAQPELAALRGQAKRR